VNRRHFLGWMAGAATWGWSNGWSQARADWQPVYQQGLPLNVVRPEDAPDLVQQALAVARHHIETHCTNPGFPNAVNHGIRALGRDLSLGADDPYRMVLSTFLQESYLQGQLFLEVPVQREGHRHALLKTLIEKECAFDLDFDIDGRAYTFADYVRSARLLHSFDLSVLPLDEQSWAILAFTRVTSPRQARWFNLNGEIQDLDNILRATSSGLRADTRLVRSVDLRSEDLPRNCDAFSRACGGLHMLYALAAALSCGYGNESLRSEFHEHMQTHLRRFTYDLRVIEEVEALNRDRASVERAAARAFDGRLKFLGHSLEILGIVDQFDLHALSGADRDTVDAGRDHLCQWIIETRGSGLANFQADRQLFDSVVTGLCHAYNGLLMSPA
jgi:hypothetical protein